MSTATQNAEQVMPPVAKTTLAEMRPQNDKIQDLPAISVGLTTLQGFDLVQRAAKCLAASTLVPKDYQNNISNCVVALNMAARVGADPLMVMQNLVVVHGRPTWSSQFMIATANSCGRFSALRFEFFGEKGKDTYGCRAWAIEKSTGEKLIGTDVTIALAKAEGWHGKNGSKWKTMEQQMLMYRAGSWWVRAYAPELSMGLHTKEEMHDVWDAKQDDDGTYSVNLDSLRNDKPENNSTLAEGESIDAETGEITKPEEKALQPERIPAKSLPGDATKTDWDVWAMEWARFVESMHDEQSLKKLRKVNESLLANLEKMNPPKHGWCIEKLTERMVAVGAVQ